MILIKGINYNNFSGLKFYAIKFDISGRILGWAIFRKSAIGKFDHKTELFKT